MPKVLKTFLYFLVFVTSFVFFLYLSFPYDVIKDRVIGVVEQQLGGKYSVSVEELSPYWFTGVEMGGVTIQSTNSTEGKPQKLTIKNASGRASIFSLIFGRPSISFELEFGKGTVEGNIRYSEEFLNIGIGLDKMDMADLSVFTSGTNLSMSSRISGDINLSIDKQNPVRSEGSISLDLDSIKVLASDLKLGEMSMPVPDLELTKSSGSSLKLDIGKGTIVVKSFKLAEGDLQIDLNGKVFLSNVVDNYRFNLQGSLKASEKLEKALPFLFIVEKQKREDGSFPISVMGRLARPIIKVGTFTLPI